MTYFASWSGICLAKKPRQNEAIRSRRFATLIGQSSEFKMSKVFKRFIFASAVLVFAFDAQAYAEGYVRFFVNNAGNPHIACLQVYENGLLQSTNIFQP